MKIWDTSNQRNVRSIFLCVNKGHECSANILETPSRNKYITPQIQNEIISSCGNLILQKIVEKVNDSHGLSKWNLRYICDWTTYSLCVDCVLFLIKKTMYLRAFLNALEYI